VPWYAPTTRAIAQAQRTESSLATDKPTGSVETDVAPPPASQRLGGARADFVASLGRKIAELRGVLATLEGAPDSIVARDDLRRKLHALGTGARMLRFEGMTRCIVDTESVLERASEDGAIRAADLERVARALDDLPTLAWGEERPADAPPPAVSLPPEPPSVKTLTPDTVSVLVVGPEDLADALVEDMGSDDGTFECERVDDLAKARSVALALAPDVVVLDGDLPGAADLAQLLLDDPLTEAAPVIVVLTPGRGDGTTRLMALGVAKILPRPLRAGAVRAACQEAIDQRDGKTIELTLGEPTVAQLGERLATEVRRALVDAVDEHGRSLKVSLGDGTEVWGALWGAIARVREVVTTKTGGMVQFTGHGPEGALALAPILNRVSGSAPSERAADVGRNRDEAMDVNLVGRRVIVADDDPGVTWFIADLLRTAGCVVHEALDGKTALRMAYDVAPELVVSDILMPGLDGFALCRALRRDVALRDTPVILLSWKEDLLQRVRELGASAAAYLRKESDARSILARVREVMRPRARIATRLRGEGEVRGRLDGLTVRTLFELVIAARPAARVSVRDASFLYEVELRGGGIHRASRTSGDGTFLRGDRVIPAMLGVGAGRFVVSSTKSKGDDAPAQPLAEQFARPIALARSALHATTGARMMTVAKVTLDEEDVSGYLLATPEPARELVRRLARGASPREILLHGDVSPALIEDVLADLATRGAIVAVYRMDGSDAMRGEAFDAKEVLPDAEGGRSSLVPPPSSASRPPGPNASLPAKAPQATGARKDTPVGSSLGAAVMHAVSDEEPRKRTPSPFPSVPEGAYESPPPPRPGGLRDLEPTPGMSSPLVPKDVSIPVVVEPTADLRLKPGESAPMSMRTRPSKVVEPDEPAVFPRPLAIGLVVLALAVAAIGARVWMSEQPPPPTTVIQSS
jgi:DNA-binding response OmpR family regulator